MTEISLDKAAEVTGTRVGVIISGDWAKIPGSTAEDSQAKGEAAKQALKKVIRNAIEKTGRFPDIQRGQDLEEEGQVRPTYDVFVHPPFEPYQHLESIALANDISDAWRPQLAIIDLAIVPHIDTFQARLLEDIS